MGKVLSFIIASHPLVDAPARAARTGKRMSYHADPTQVSNRSDKAAGPTAGTATVDPLEFLARVVTPIPDPGRVMRRYYAWYASQTRSMRRRQANDAPGSAGPSCSAGFSSTGFRSAGFR